MNQEVIIKKRRGRPAKSENKVMYVPSIINFDNKLERLKDLDIDPRMMETMQTGLPVDPLISHEGGVPCGSNIMVTGDPGVGKTTVMLDVLSGIQVEDKKRKCLFISGEMGRKQMYKYTQRFKQFGIIETLFTTDFTDYNAKDVIEQVLDRGYDCVLIDSIAEIMDDVRDENNWDRKTAEGWLVDVCSRNNIGENKVGKFTSFLLIQQVGKNGVFSGSNKLKHLVNAHMELKNISEKQGGGTEMYFSKNRDGNAGLKMNFGLSNNKIEYGMIVGVEEYEETEGINC